MKWNLVLDFLILNGNFLHDFRAISAITAVSAISAIVAISSVLQLISVNVCLEGKFQKKVLCIQKDFDIFLNGCNPVWVQCHVYQILVLQQRLALYSLEVEGGNYMLMIFYYSLLAKGGGVKYLPSFSCACLCLVG